jgi:hypothetical protein
MRHIWRIRRSTAVSCSSASRPQHDQRSPRRVVLPRTLPNTTGLAAVLKARFYEDFRALADAAGLADGAGYRHLTSTGKWRDYAGCSGMGGQSYPQSYPQFSGLAFTRLGHALGRYPAVYPPHAISSIRSRATISLRPATTAASCSRSKGSCRSSKGASMPISSLTWLRRPCSDCRTAGDDAATVHSSGASSISTTASTQLWSVMAASDQPGACPISHWSLAPTIWVSTQGGADQAPVGPRLPNVLFDHCVEVRGGHQVKWAVGDTQNLGIAPSTTRQSARKAAAVASLVRR